MAVALRQHPSIPQSSPSPGPHPPRMCTACSRHLLCIADIVIMNILIHPQASPTPTSTSYLRLPLTYHFLKAKVRPSSMPLFIFNIVYGLRTIELQPPRHPFKLRSSSHHHRPSPFLPLPNPRLARTCTFRHIVHTPPPRTCATSALSSPKALYHSPCPPAAFAIFTTTPRTSYAMLFRHPDS